ncbi:Uncharacterized protein Rs2_12997 [Raphanus sativus]|uniref:Uncharacterized protein LOC130511728 n=1 Tax=Raphanus sativus TaxID=3726 RepID=A0A9W3DMK1_RAPSA|nr:uncharacterized protein LOC130511728 [Raphanus sativus]KAJ4899046.1 Uncharacterized protein Rs2_12997 [Raphanus sativus]
MKEITDLVDPRRIMFKHQSLMQDYHDLRKETEYKMRKLEMMKRKRSALDAQVRFLRRRYKHLKQDQSHETSSPNMLRLSESRGALKVSNNGKRKKSSGQGTSFGLKLKDTVCDEKNELSAKRSSRGNEVLTSSIPLPDLNDNNTLVTNKVSGFDLNLISGEEEDPEANGEAAKNTMIGNGMDCEMKLPICRDVEKEISRAAVKRKVVSWQDPVALRV